MPYEAPEQPVENPLLTELVNGPSDEKAADSAVDVTAGAQPEPSAEEAMANLRGFFDTIVPRDTVEFIDAYGGEHVSNALLPARRQVKVMRELEALLDANVDLSILGKLGDEGGVDAAVRMLVEAAGNEQILSGLGKAFAAAHPGPVAVARRTAEAAESELPADMDAADLFPIEELMAGLLPFSVRLATRLLDAVGRVPQISDQSAQAI